ncbi:MAG: type IV pilin protein [Pseudomonadota bacterium]
MSRASNNQDKQTEDLLVQPKRQSGFTLIEVLIAVAILGIVLALAVPSYSRYITDSRRIDAQIALRDAAQRMERCRTQSFTYVGCDTNVQTNSPEGYYTVSVTAAAATFTVTATPVTGKSQAKDTDCPTLTLDNTGLEGPTATAATCW